MNYIGVDMSMCCSEHYMTLCLFTSKKKHTDCALVTGVSPGCLPNLSIYRQGEWLDLCTGPHLPSTGRLGKAFKLMKLAGAYWRGDPRNPQLQRIYSTCWRNEKELKAYLHRLEEAEKRDHRRLGREMDLFHIQEEEVGRAQR